MENITQVATTALQTVATKSTPRSSLFMFDIGRPDTCVAIDLILNAQPSVTPHDFSLGRTFFEVARGPILCMFFEVAVVASR